MTWQPAGPQGVRDTQDAIVRLLGFTKETFLASSLLLQGAASFASKDTSRVERCDLLMDGLGLTEYDAYRGLAEAERKAAEKTMLRLADRIEQDAVELERKPGVSLLLAQAVENETASVMTLAKAQLHLEAVTLQRQQADRRVSERRAAEAEHEAAEKERRRLREQAEQADSARDSIRAAEDRLGVLYTPEEAASQEQAYSEALRAYNEYFAKRAELVGRRQNLMGRQVCPTCERPYANAGEVVASIARVNAMVDELEDPGCPSDLEVTRAREQMQERARLEERISAWQRAVTLVQTSEWLHDFAMIEGLVALTAEKLAALPPIDQAEIDRIKQQGLQARAAVHEAQQQLDRVRADKTRAETEVERLTLLEAKHTDEKAQHARAQEEATLAAACEQMYGRDGLPTHIIRDVAVPYLEEEATRIVRLLGKQWEIQIRVEKGLKSRDGTIAALDVQPIKENGVEQPYGICSGGERMRIDLALMGAFLRLFRQRRNAHSDLFAIDEPEGLDAAGREMLVLWLHDLARTVPVVQLITHHTDLRDSFEQVVEVCHENGRSRILAGDRAAELVTA